MMSAAVFGQWHLATILLSSWATISKVLLQFFLLCSYRAGSRRAPWLKVYSIRLHLGAAFLWPSEISGRLKLRQTARIGPAWRPACLTTCVVSLTATGNLLWLVTRGRF